MAYVDLNRSFVRVNPGDPLGAEGLASWSRLYRSVSWPDVLEHSRVVILAEAGSGKTEEFKQRAKLLKDEGKDAFFAALEQVAQRGLEKTLGPARQKALREWLASSRPGWLFLDSVDEAKLQSHSFADALADVAETLGEAAARARVFVSCRGTDWNQVRDLEVMKEQLPTPVPTPDAEADADQLLLSVLDSETNKTKAPEKPNPEPLIFSLADLLPDQQRAFLVAQKVEEIGAFEEEMRLRGLHALAERPGDLAMLVRAWKSRGQFGSLREMLEEHITERLRERPERDDASLLTDLEAREAAERIAAAMTLSKRLTIRASSDGEPPEDAVDPAQVLPDLKANQRAALLRRGIFAPATFGLVRFHHRSALEYLTASWFRRLHVEGRLSERAILKIFSREAFGVVTTPPSLRPAGAWLAPDCQGLLAFMRENIPLALIAFGDPSGLPLQTKVDLLRTYAQKHAAGQVPYEFLDRHSLWMFADDRLAEPIREAWALNGDPDFRLELIRLVEVGRIRGCYDLLREEALDTSAQPHNRVAAARAMNATEDAEGQKALADLMLRSPGDYGPRSAPHLAAALFPAALSVADVLRLIDQSPPARPYQVEGFGYVLTELFGQCPNEAAREELIAGVAELCLSPPLEPYQAISKRHNLLAGRLGDLCRLAIIRSGSRPPSKGLIRLLQAAERADLDTYGSDEPSLSTMVRERPDLNRQLFLSDVRLALSTDPDAEENPRVWRLRAHLRGQLWALGESDRGWLEELCLSGPKSEARVALSALYLLAGQPAESEAFLDSLAGRLAQDETLSADLRGYRKPHKESAIERKWRERQEVADRKRSVKTALAAQEWRRIRQSLRDDTGQLSDAGRIAEWPGHLNLMRLTQWLQGTTKLDLLKAPTEWVFLKSAFGSSVAEAYVAGMRAMWRVTVPERPTIDEEGRTVTKWAAVLAVSGLNLEAAQPGGLEKLRADEARLAAEHLCLDDQTLPEWLGKLIRLWPNEAAPLVLSEIQREWPRPENAYTPFIYRAENGLDLVPQIRAGLLALVDREPAHVRQVEAGRRFLRRAELTAAERSHYASIIQTRLSARSAPDDWPWRLAFLKTLFELDLAAATGQLRQTITREPPKLRRARAEEAVGELFGMRGNGVVGLDEGDVATLEALLRLTYEIVRPADDKEREGHYSPDTRDEAEMGRNRVLTALINKGGAEAFAALSRMAADGAVGERAHRFRQIAWEVGERATDDWRWRPRDVWDTERGALSPVQSGEALLSLTCDAIDDISLRFQRGDFSSRELLEGAQNEFAVQNWLAEQLELRTRGRCTVTREKQVIHENRPDISLSSSTSPVEVALELKHAEKGWTLPDLRSSLKDQLAEDYLQVPQRRHGLFVVTNHRQAKFWRDPESKQPLSFAQVMEILAADARQFQRNSVQAIKVEVRGIEAAKPSSPRKRRKKAKPSPKA